MTGGWITKEELLDTVRAAGFDPPAQPQLDRLTRAGLLQRPSQHHPSGRRGSQTRYSAEAATQLAGVLRLRQQVRSLDQLRFWAWWDGLWVNPHSLHNTLIRWAAAAVRSFEKEVRPYDDPLDAVDAIHQKVARAGHDGPRWLRHRVGIGDTPDAVDLLLLVAAGGQPDWQPQQLADIDPRAEREATPEETLTKAFALDKLAQPPSPGSPIPGPLVPEPPTAQELTATLQEAGLASPGNWLRAVRSASIPELSQARPIARAIVEDLPLVALAAGRYAQDPADPWGLGPFRASRRRNRRALEHTAATVGQAILLRRTLPSTQLNDFVEAVTSSAAEIRETLEMRNPGP
ncbi:MAG: hypothetical protein JW785_06125 [Acidimicrobiia bacterium]|nr:hypothetical protein [Acidimicrobiia bacterium]